MAMSGSSTDSTNPLPTQPHEPRSTSRPPLNPINLCALCLSAPLREAKRQRAKRRILYLLNLCVRQNDDARRREKGNQDE